MSNPTRTDNTSEHSTDQQPMICLMYHALYHDESELSEIPTEEQPYALSTHLFEAQLDKIEALNLPIVNPLIEGFRPGIVLTFDDGHKSFYHHAYRILKARGYSGVFFITPKLVESRNDFCSWEQLKTMAHDGMSIESHGHTHQFLSDLSDHEVATELEKSKESIEAQCENEVLSISFPGGRFNKRVVELAHLKNYRYCFSSEIGTIHNTHFAQANLTDRPDAPALERIALKQNTTMQEFEKIISANKAWFFHSRLFANSKRLIKTLLGNHLYHLVYKVAAKIK